MRNWVGYIISSASSLLISVRHFNKFNLSLVSYIKYVKKSINLSLCYSSFAANKKFATYRKVGEIAFFSSSYDIITDGKAYDPFLKVKYFKILKSKANIDICSLTEEMYLKDFENSFNNGGLERGATSLRIILLYLGSINYFQSKCDISELGEILQITDDIIDYEEDKALNETNCFLLNERNEYAVKYRNYFSNTWALKLFENSPVMGYLIKKSLGKLDKILGENLSVSKKSVSFVPIEL